MGQVGDDLAREMENFAGTITGKRQKERQRREEGRIQAEIDRRNALIEAERKENELKDRQASGAAKASRAKKTTQRFRAGVASGEAVGALDPTKDFLGL